MSFIFAVLWLVSSSGARLERLHVDLDGYDVVFARPAGWSTQGTGAGTALQRPGAEISFDWYQPPNRSQYEDFDRRIESEIRSRREEYGTVHVQRRRIGMLHAVEVRFVDKQGWVFAETYIGVPRKPRGGELFMITLQGNSGKAGEADLQAYHRLLDALKVTRDDD